MAEISVIIPAYNQAAYIRNAIQSVYNQTFSDWELIIVDDGSTDETALVLAGFQDPRITIIRQTNHGVSAARNTGFQHSSAPLITFLDADDLFLPEKMSVLYEYLKAHPDIGMVVGGMQSMDSAGKICEEKVIEADCLCFPGLLLENNIPLGGVMFRREWLERTGGFDESMHTCEDWDVWLRMSIAGCHFASVDKMVVAYRIHSGQVTRNAAKMRIDSFRLWEKFFNLPGLPAELLAYRNQAVASALIRTSARAFRSNEFEIANLDLINAIELDPELSDANYKKIVDLFKGWANDPQTADPESYLIKVSKNISPKLPKLRRQFRKAVADLILGSLFGTPRELWSTKRRALIQAVSYNPSYLTNRGVLKMLVVSLFTPVTREVV